MKLAKIHVLALHTLIISVLFVIAITKGIKFQADMLSVLPAGNDKQIILDAESLLFERLSNQLVVSFVGDKKTAAYDEFVQFVNKQGWKLKVADAAVLEKLADVYTPYAGLLLSPSYQAQLDSTERFHSFFAQQLSQIAQPFVSKTFSQDPSLASASYLAYLLSNNVNLQVENNRFVAAHQAGKPVLAFIDIAPQHSQMNKLDYAIEVANRLANEQQRLATLYPNVKITSSGIALHTAQNAAQAKWEMNTFGALSLFGTMLLVMWAFKAFAPLIWMVSSVALAMFTGFTALVWCFEQVHLMTLVFGVTLIGLAVDYSLHVLSHHQVKTSVKVSRTLVFAFLTTALCYALFYFTPLAILKQVAVFVGAGLFAALLVSLTLEERLIKRADLSNKRTIELVVFKRYIKRAQQFTIVFVGTFIVWSFFKPLSFDDSIKQFNASSTALLQAEHYHGQLLQQQDKVRVFVYADSLEELLQQEESLATKLHSHYPQVKINKLSDWLPSEQRQANNFARYQQAESSGVFAALQHMMPTFSVNERPRFLSYQTLNQETVTDYFSHLYTTVDNNHVSIVELSGISSEQVSALIASEPNMMMFDKQTSLNKVLIHFRHQLSYWLMFAVGIILLILCWRFDVKTALKASVVLAGTIYGALVLAQQVQGHLTLFNLLSAILVIGLAVDYLIFYRERQVTQGNVLAISLSSASSLMVFGMLALSKTPAIYHFGLTVTFGLILVYVLAPLVVKEENENRNS
ncbi:MMPL family transporter [Thalassotalea marina]|uniref:Bifunctional glycerol-3-phosphate dehydrogenase/glycerol-3-phosphate acyltransferase n=1 Tax=Thalassotalea marina TaxID=1673741 RepID=A0A919EM49_9GAMM|nr:hypothetical protein [Thalassotalea marina]GHF97119.1 bifunctional glycerol-3-phosphate dehydrogenase/glycerol-3-phosphate acyltransferase [Thalassotalea marina]